MKYFDGVCFTSLSIVYPNLPLLKYCGNASSSQISSDRIEVFIEQPSPGAISHILLQQTHLLPTDNFAMDLLLPCFHYNFLFPKFLHPLFSHLQNQLTINFDKLPSFIYPNILMKKKQIHCKVISRQQVNLL